jgi:hypothetical protein
MRLLRSAAAMGIAKVVYDQARKPENQARLRALVEKAKERRAGGARPAGQGRR